MKTYGGEFARRRIDLMVTNRERGGRHYESETGRRDDQEKFSQGDRRGRRQRGRGDLRGAHAAAGRAQGNQDRVGPARHRPSDHDRPGSAQGQPAGGQDGQRRRRHQVHGRGQDQGPPGRFRDQTGRRTPRGGSADQGRRVGHHRMLPVGHGHGHRHLVRTAPETIRHGRSGHGRHHQEGLQVQLPGVYHRPGPGRGRGQVSQGGHQGQARHAQNCRGHQHGRPLRPGHVGRFPQVHGQVGTADQDRRSHPVPLGHPGSVHRGGQDQAGQTRYHLPDLAAGRQRAVDPRTLQAARRTYGHLRAGFPRLVRDRGGQGPG